LAAGQVALAGLRSGRSDWRMFDRTRRRVLK
jgi:hypothetical protein